jgi:hypothetical protein
MSIANRYQSKAMTGLRLDDINQALRHIDDALAMLIEGDDTYDIVQIARDVLRVVAERYSPNNSDICDVIGCADLLREAAEQLPLGEAQTVLFKAVAALWDRTPSRTYRK